MFKVTIKVVAVAETEEDAENFRTVCLAGITMTAEVTEVEAGVIRSNIEPAEMPKAEAPKPARPVDPKAN